MNECKYVEPFLHGWGQILSKLNVGIQILPTTNVRSKISLSSNLGCQYALQHNIEYTRLPRSNMGSQHFLNPIVGYPSSSYSNMRCPSSSRLFVMHKSPSSYHVRCINLLNLKRDEITPPSPMTNSKPSQDSSWGVESPLGPKLDGNLAQDPMWVVVHS